MDAASFIKESGELVKKLERFGITQSRKCAVTLFSGDGICVDFARSDISTSDLHRSLKNAFPSDSLIMSYEVSSKCFDKFHYNCNLTLTDASNLIAASAELKSLLIRICNEPPHPKLDDSFHVVYTGTMICIGGDSFAALESNAFILEQYVRKLDKLISIKDEAVRTGGSRAADIIMMLEDMENGRIYIKDRKNGDKK